MKVIARAALLFLLAAGLVSQASASPLQPSGKWVVNFADAQCIASREYGTAERPMTLVFKAPATGDVLQIAVLRKGDSGIYAEQIDGRVRFGTRAEIKQGALIFSPDKGKRRIVLFNLPRSEVAGWTGNQPLELQASGQIKETFAITGVATVLKVMDECVADLKRQWNYSEMGGPSVLKQHASANLVKLFDTRDYPYVSVASEEQGTATVVVLVDERGKVADCTLVQTSGVAALDAQTCAVIRARAKYKPAIGADGKPARDVDYARIRWLLR